MSLQRRLLNFILKNNNFATIDIIS
jgi:hypothetical protein